MEAAWQLLLEKGFAAVTVDDVIARSGGSRTTLYKAFGGKEGLLQAVMAAKCAEFSEELHVSLESHLPPQEALTRFATTFANRILDEDAARFMYLLMTEGKHCPSIVDTFLARGPNNTLDHLARYLARQHDAGALHIPDPHHYAEMFIAMIAGDCQQRLLVGQQPQNLTPDRIEARVRNTIDLFLNGTRPPAAGDQRAASSHAPLPANGDDNSATL